MPDLKILTQNINNTMSIKQTATTQPKVNTQAEDKPQEKKTTSQTTYVLGGLAALGAISLAIYLSRGKLKKTNPKEIPNVVTETKEKIEEKAENTTQKIEDKISKFIHKFKEENLTFERGKAFKEDGSAFSGTVTEAKDKALKTYEYKDGLIQKVKTEEDGKTIIEKAYKYSSDGKLESIELTSAEKATPEKIYNRVCNKDKNIETITTSNSIIEKDTKLNKPITITYPNGIKKGDVTINKRQYQYSTEGNLKYEQVESSSETNPEIKEIKLYADDGKTLDMEYSSINGAKIKGTDFTAKIAEPEDDRRQAISLINSNKSIQLTNEFGPTRDPYTGDIYETYAIEGTYKGTPITNRVRYTKENDKICFQDKTLQWNDDFYELDQNNVRCFDTENNYIFEFDNSTDKFSDIENISEKDARKLMQTMIDREKEIFNLHTTIIEQANKLSKAWKTFNPS